MVLFPKYGIFVDSKIVLNANEIKLFASRDARRSYFIWMICILIRIERFSDSVNCFSEKNLCSLHVCLKILSYNFFVC